MKAKASAKKLVGPNAIFPPAADAQGHCYYYVPKELCRGSSDGTNRRQNYCGGQVVLPVARAPPPPEMES